MKGQERMDNTDTQLTMGQEHETERRETKQRTREK